MDHASVTTPQGGRAGYATSLGARASTLSTAVGEVDVTAVPTGVHVTRVGQAWDARRLTALATQTAMTTACVTTPPALPTAGVMMAGSAMRVTSHACMANNIPLEAISACVMWAGLESTAT